MNYDIDIWLVFAARDNEPLPLDKGGKGWVSHFQKFLEMVLAQAAGTKPRVVTVNESSSFSISDVNHSSVMIPILSKNFMEAGKCLEIVEQFHSQTSAHGQNHVFFKVLKAPLAPRDQPPVMRDWTGYDMFQTDSKTAAGWEYTDFFSPEAERQFWMKLVDLAYDIRNSMSAWKAKEMTRSPVKGKTVFLAETASDLSAQRNVIRRELQRYGYGVLPAYALPSSLDEAEKAVKNALENSSIAIHLIGNLYGEAPRGSDLSMVEIQNEMASETAREGWAKGQKFLRLLWLTPELGNASKEQLAFISRIKRSTEAQSGAEIFQNSIEDFKNLLRREFLEKTTATEEMVQGRSLYLIYDQTDADGVAPFKEVISKEGIKVLEPVFKGDLLTMRKQHTSNLRNMDAALIFKGKVNDQWVRMKVMDLLKAPGFGRTKPIRAKGIIASGDLNSLNGFRNQQITLISGDTDRSIENMKALIKEI